jgi:dTDP-4-dehydrorhamnose 3,5-epimerase
VCVGGRARIGLYDDREGSLTRGETQTVILGFPDQSLLVIPPGVYHGFTPVGTESAYIVNIPTELYDYAEPDEYRRPFDDPEIGYDWGAVIGG